MAQDVGLLLRGLGAAFSNTVPQFRQEMAQEQEAQYVAQQRQQAMQAQNAEMLQARQKAMYQDADSALKLLVAGDLDGIVALGQDRLQLLSNFPDADPSDTARLTQFAMKARAGDPAAFNGLMTELLQTVSRGMQMGLIEPPKQPEIIPAASVVNGQVITRDAEGNIVSERPKGFQPEVEARPPIEVGGRLLDPESFRVLYEPPVDSQLDEYSPGITRYRNGVAVQYSRQGNVRVLDEEGRPITGAAAKAAIERGINSGVTEAGQIAGSQAQGRGVTEREQGIINAGVDAIAQFPTITRSLDLLDEVKTGGISAVATRARSLFGVEGGDEGELSYNLSMNVLQQLKPIFGSAFTAGEGARLDRIEASLGRSPETNRRLLNQALNIARTSVDKAYVRAEASGDTATATELQNALNMLEEWNVDLSVPKEWTDLGGTPEAWNRQPNDVKREFIRAK